MRMIIYATSFTRGELPQPQPRNENLFGRRGPALSRRAMQLLDDAKQLEERIANLRLLLREFATIGSEVVGGLFLDRLARQLDDIILRLRDGLHGGLDVFVIN